MTDQHQADFRDGKSCYERGQFAEAAAYFKAMLARASDDADAWSGWGASVWAMGNPAEAQEAFENAVKLKPADPRLALNFGEFLYDNGRVDDALGRFNRALELAPDYKPALWHKSFALLAKGEYREGWKLYAECLGPGYIRANRFNTPPWNGAADPAKRLLIWCEQGLGDFMQFIRYAQLCKQRMGRVSVFCPKPLLRLFQNLPFVDHASDTCDTKDFDEHVPMMNLPHIFGTALNAVPADVPYLFADHDLAAKWKLKFDDAPSDMKVGIVWAGGAHQGKTTARLMDSQRSIPFDLLRPLLDLPGATFYSLQKDTTAHGLIDFMGEVTDFADTAAIIQNLDLIISVDTSVAHLAGGLGKPVWIMSRTNADWRWLENKPQNPWYPAARIFGQPKMGDWASVITAIKRELALEISRRA